MQRPRVTTEHRLSFLGSQCTIAIGISLPEDLITMAGFWADAGVAKNLPAKIMAVRPEQRGDMLLTSYLGTMLWSFK